MGLGLLGHAAFPPEDHDASTSCLSSTGSCTLADIFMERLYLELRSRTLCKSPDPPRSCGRAAAPQSLGAHPELQKALLCARASDGRTLLHIAVAGKSAEL